MGLEIAVSDRYLENQPKKDFHLFTAVRLIARKPFHI
jgi:hypothetical protein